MSSVERKNIVYSLYPIDFLVFGGNTTTISNKQA